MSESAVLHITTDFDIYYIPIIYILCCTIARSHRKWESGLTETAPHHCHQMRVTVLRAVLRIGTLSSYPSQICSLHETPSNTFRIPVFSFLRKIVDLYCTKLSWATTFEKCFTQVFFSNNLWEARKKYLTRFPAVSLKPIGSLWIVYLSTLAPNKF